MNRTGRTLITTKSIFMITLLVFALTILAVWLFGLGRHRTLFVNSVLSTSILSAAFFLFLVISLYRGVKMKDDLGKITDTIKRSHFPGLPESLEVPEIADLSFGEGCGEVFLAVLAWILAAFLILLLIWLFGALLWSLVLIFAAMLYWIFFRALRLVFKNSNACKDDLGKSFRFAFGYTLLYSFWIYGIILLAHYLV